MSAPATQWMALITEILIVMYSVIIIYRLYKIEDQIKELNKLYGNSTVCAHRDESHRTGDKSPVCNETDDKNS